VPVPAANLEVDTVLEALIVFFVTAADDAERVGDKQAAEAGFGSCL